MNKQRQPLKQAVKIFYETHGLSDTQLHSLQQMIAEKAADSPHEKSVSWRWLSSIAASLLISIAIFTYLQTPAVVTAAYSDTQKDAALNNGLQASVSQWINENQIDAVPAQYRVEMSKFCRLDRYQTSHLRVAGVEQGKLHLFFHHGGHPLNWFNRSGTVDKMNWKLIKVRRDLSLIVMYSDDMRETAVRDILHQMLPELQA